MLFSIFSIIFVIVALSSGESRADLLDCDERILPTLADVQAKIGYEDSSSTSHADAVTNFFKKWGCEIKKGASKLGTEVKQGAKKLKEKAQDLGSKLESKFTHFKEQLTKDSAESLEANDKYDFSSVINADVLKTDAFRADLVDLCGHGQLLDALGRCRNYAK